MARRLISLANSLIGMITGLALLLAGSYAAYCLWDNSRIYAAAENVQAELLALKPLAENQEATPTFDELTAINPDVRGWVTMEGTKIDHPVLQGESNMDYINTDVYGNFALAGSIFLDFRCSPDFSDPYCLLYGHHMDNSGMFGDLDLYLDGEFFGEHTTGELITPLGRFPLRTVACLQTKASEELIFDPTGWSEDLGGLLDFAEAQAIHLQPQVLRSLRADLSSGAPVRLLALTTCSSAFTDARTIVLTELRDYPQEESGDTIP